jgi:hypothetical protein
LGCTAGLDAAGAYVPATPTSLHAGERLSVRMNWPREYFWIVGFEQSTMLQASPSSGTDQSRLGLLGGFGDTPHAEGSSTGYELTGHLGAIRGSLGEDLVHLGGYFDAEAALLWRPARAEEPWENDGYLRTTFLLVPSIGGGGILMNEGDWAVRPEIRFGLGVRFQLWPTLIP